MSEAQMDFLDLMESDQNDPNVQYALGRCYLYGDGVEQNGQEADKWLRRAAEQGHQEAAALLASAQEETPETVPLTEETLPDWCLRAEEGDMDAQFQTAEYFLQHYPDTEQADIERYLTMAAEQGHPGACLLLAKQKLEKQPKEAVELLRNAADCGLWEAASLLGECCSQGRGVEKDAQEAERRFIQAAKLGGGEQMLNLAVRYAVGNGVAPSQGKALSWVKKAQDSGLADARSRFDGRCAEEQERQKQREEEARRQAEAEAQRQAEEKARQQAEETARQAREEAERQAAQKRAEEARQQAARAQKEQEKRNRISSQQRRGSHAKTAAICIGVLLMAYAGLCTLYRAFTFIGATFDAPTERIFQFLLPQSEWWQNVVVFFLPGVCETGRHMLRYTLPTSKTPQRVGTVLVVINMVYMVALWLNTRGFSALSVLLGAILAVVYVVCNMKLAAFLVSKLRKWFSRSLGADGIWPDLRNG